MVNHMPTIIPGPLIDAITAVLPGKNRNEVAVPARGICT